MKTRARISGSFMRLPTMLNKPRNNRKTRLRRLRKGVTLVQLLVAMFISLIVISGITTLLVQATTAWADNFEDNNSDASVARFTAVTAFTTLARQASSEASAVTISAQADDITIEYYSSSSLTSPDMYGRFYFQDGALMEERGTLSPSVSQSLYPVCDNVQDCYFEKIGDCISMRLEVDDNGETVTIIAAAILNNP